MSYSKWLKLGTTISGDISFSFSRGEVYSDSVDFLIVGYSSKWTEFDLSFKYRESENDEWREDAIIVSSQSLYVNQNNLIGLSASNNGQSNIFRWKFLENNIFYGKGIQVEFKILPRLLSFSSSGSFNIVSQTYGDNKVNLQDSSKTKKCIGSDKLGRYICSNDNSVEIFDFLSDTIPVVTFAGVSGSKNVIQKESGEYIIADYGNNLVFEISETLVVSKSYSVPSPIYLDFQEDNETLLICSETNKAVYEISWSELDSSTLLWQSDIRVTDPISAKYGYSDADTIVITDSNKVWLYNKISGFYKSISEYKMASNCGAGGAFSFYNPYRSFLLTDGRICIVEKNGCPINFETFESSSSSSSSSSIDSSSSSSSSSSSGGVFGDFIYLENLDILVTEGSERMIYE